MAKEIKIKIPEFAELWQNARAKMQTLIAHGTVHLRHAARRAWHDIRTKKIGGGIVVAVSAAAFWQWGISAGLLWLLFTAFLVYAWENRIIAVFALVSLASCPFLLAFEREALAETMAMYAYFFLVMTVVLQIVEYKREERGDE